MRKYTRHYYREQELDVKKQCKVCKKIKTLQEFYHAVKNSSTGKVTYRSLCKPCERLRRKNRARNSNSNSQTSSQNPPAADKFRDYAAVDLFFEQTTDSQPDIFSMFPELVTDMTFPEPDFEQNCEQLDEDVCWLVSDYE